MPPFSSLDEGEREGEALENRRPGGGEKRPLAWVRVRVRIRIRIRVGGRNWITLLLADEIMSFATWRSEEEGSFS